MGTHERRIDSGTDRARRIVRELGRELRDARREHGLSQAVVAGSVGVAPSTISRIERAQLPGVAVEDLARALAVVGLELSARAFPTGSPLRDGAHAELLADLATVLPRGVRLSLEVPIPLPGDRRSWDGLIRGKGWTCGVEAETAPRDLQALLRRSNLKARDAGVDALIVLVRDTRRTRLMLREHAPLLAAELPIPAAEALQRLKTGVSPGGHTLLMLSRRPR